MAGAAADPISQESDRRAGISPCSFARPERVGTAGSAFFPNFSSDSRISNSSPVLALKRPARIRTADWEKRSRRAGDLKAEAQRPAKRGKPTPE